MRDERWFEVDKSSNDKTIREVEVESDTKCFITLVDGCKYKKEGVYESFVQGECDAVEVAKAHAKLDAEKARRVAQAATERARKHDKTFSELSKRIDELNS